MKTILVTGGAGFIGSNFVKYLWQKYPDYKIIILDLLTYAGSVDNFPVRPGEQGDRFEFVYGDVKNASLVETLVQRADVVVHFAAETHVTRSIFDDRQFYATDILGTQAIANAVVKYDSRIERFLHISSSEVYGSAETDSMDEFHPLNPTSPYASAKAGADRLVYSYFRTYDIDGVIVRPFNNYGPRQHLEKLIPRFITSCLLNEDLHVHGDGLMSRDWLHAYDTARALDILIHADLEKVKGEAFNIGTGRHISVREIADIIVKFMDYDPARIKHIDNRPGQVERHTCNYHKIYEAVGWKPEIGFEEGLIQTIEWFKANRDAWEKQRWLRQIPIKLKDGREIVH